MISKEEIEAVLRESLEDRRLSREERHDLKALLGDAPLGDEERAFLRNRVFAVANEVADDTPAVALAMIASIRLRVFYDGVSTPQTSAFSPLPTIG